MYKSKINIFSSVSINTQKVEVAEVLNRKLARIKAIRYVKFIDIHYYYILFLVDQTGTVFDTSYANECKKFKQNKY